jgi:hypothetical protein
MNTVSMQHRQGDLLFIKETSIPKKVKKVTTGSIVHSDHTNHTHKLVGGVLVQDTKGNSFSNLTKKGKVVHEEHKTTVLDKGIWENRRQREYSSKDMTKIVID